MRYTMHEEKDRHLPKQAARRWRRWPLAAAAVVATCLSGSLAWGQQPKEKLVPASYGLKTDSQGFRWDINRYGRIGSGTDSCFSEAMYLSVNNSSFNSPQSAMMTADGSEYVLSRSVSNLQVTRRIKVDVKASAVRYLEMLHNPGSAPVTAQVMLRTQVPRGPCQALITDKGAPAGVSLGKKDGGVVVIGRPNSGQLALVFHLAGARGKVKPTIQNQSNAQFTFTYTVKVEAGKTVSILHGIAQRRLHAIPDAKARAALFKPFKSRNWLRDLPREVRRSIVNLGRLGFGGWDPSQSLASLESLGVQQQASDVMAAGEQTRLHGTASCGRLAVETRYGTLKVPFEKVAAIVGDKHPSRRPRVFLRDGRVVVGKVTTEDLRFTMNTGLQLQLTAERLDRLVMRANPGDGKPQADVLVMLETIQGDRLALVRAAEQQVTATTPWGQREILLEDVRRLFAAEEGVGHRLVLRDGSRLFGFLGSSGLSFETLGFGEQEFSPIEIRTMIATHLKSSDRDHQPDIAAPHFLLVGENVLVGQVDLAAVHFVTPGAQIPVPPNQIRVMRNVSEDDEWTAGKEPLFEAELWDGGTVSGRLSELVLPVRTADRVSQVPVCDIVELRVPTPTVPDAMRNKIVRLIGDLGHPEYAKRKAASEALAELGHLAKLQLTETLKQTSDPEVRRRVEALLDGLPD